MNNLTGSIVALVTPFSADGSVDFGALGRLVDFHLQNGTDGILVLGTTGESSTMTDEEDLAVCKFVVDRVAGRIPVIGGSGSNSTAESMRKSEGLVKMGADGLLLITPYYNKSNDEGIYQHFRYVLDRVDVPCVLYNIPGRTGCSISVANVARLATHPNAWGIKEASGNISYAASVARYLSDDFRMLSGNDDMVVPIMSLGGRGVISVWADVAPATVHQMCVDYLAGNVEGRPTDAARQPRPHPRTLLRGQPHSRQGGSRQDGHDRGGVSPAALEDGREERCHAHRGHEGGWSH